MLGDNKKMCGVKKRARRLLPGVETAKGEATLKYEKVINNANARK
jgi:hypothetical protein